MIPAALALDRLAISSFPAARRTIHRIKRPDGRRAVDRSMASATGICVEHHAGHLYVGDRIGRFFRSARAARFWFLPRLSPSIAAYQPGISSQRRSVRFGGRRHLQLLRTAIHRIHKAGDVRVFLPGASAGRSASRFGIAIGIFMWASYAGRPRHCADSTVRGPGLRPSGPHSRGSGLVGMALHHPGRAILAPRGLF